MGWAGRCWGKGVDVREESRTTVHFLAAQFFFFVNGRISVPPPTPKVFLGRSDIGTINYYGRHGKCNETNCLALFSMCQK